MGSRSVHGLYAQDHAEVSRRRAVHLAAEELKAAGIERTGELCTHTQVTGGDRYAAQVRWVRHGRVRQRLSHVFVTPAVS